MNRINGFWRRGVGGGSGKVAKSRLQVVLVHDRVGVSPRVLANFRKDLVGVIGKYFEIDGNALEIDVRQVEDYHALLVNTPIIRTKAAAR
ncbi:MAG TPA: cell division topological specificity factor MinE [Thermodesulfobacteriota bacterium]